MLVANNIGGCTGQKDWLHPDSSLLRNSRMMGFIRNKEIVIRTTNLGSAWGRGSNPENVPATGNGEDQPADYGYRIGANS